MVLKQICATDEPRNVSRLACLECAAIFHMFAPDSAAAVRLKLAGIDGQGDAMPFDGKSKVGVDHNPDAVAQALRESARETIAALDHLAALFDGGKRWIRNKECDERGRFCLRGGIAHIAAGDYVGYYLRVAIRELAGPSMTIPAYNDSAPSFASIAYVISRARELAAAKAEGRHNAPDSLKRSEGATAPP